MDYRIAIVQHGDYREALERKEAGLPETYAGMYQSVEMTERLVERTTYRIINMDAPNYLVERGSGELVGIAQPKWRKGSHYAFAWMVYRAVREFQPTHILIRTGEFFSLPILRYAIDRDLDVMVMLAGYLQSGGWRKRLINRFFVDALNHPCVYRVGNHRRPASDSLIAAGVCPDKVISYDFPMASTPDLRPTKTIRPGDDVHVVYAGTLSLGKGIAEVLEAVIQLNRAGLRTRLTYCGDGPMMETLRERSSALPEGLVTFLGRVGNQTLMETMEQATFVCVASRRETSEGMPIVVTEALSTRTPLICSDHPCLTDILADGEGLRYFRSGDASSLSKVLREVAEDPEAYARLSELTKAAWHKIVSPILIHEPIERWRASWKSLKFDHAPQTTRLAHHSLSRNQT
jgi:glycosyltransferase involved in cell wall biosynthesis